jgi:hypothetical protein
VKLITNKNLYKGWRRRIKGTTGRGKVTLPIFFLTVFLVEVDYLCLGCVVHPV